MEPVKIDTSGYRIECMLPVFMAASGHDQKDTANLSEIAESSISHIVGGSTSGVEMWTVARLCLLYSCAVGDMYVLVKDGDEGGPATIVRMRKATVMPDTTGWKVSCRLNELRKLKGFSLTYVHERTGLSRSKLTDLDKNRMKKIRLDAWISLCLLFECGTGDLFVLEKESGDEAHNSPL